MGADRFGEVWFDPKNPEELAKYTTIVLDRLTIRKGKMGDQPYTPHAAQLMVHYPDVKNPWKYFVGPWGRRSGKTICAAAEAFKELGLPNTKTWIVAPSYDLTDRVFDYLWEWVVKKKLLGNRIANARHTKDARILEMEWGSRLEGRSADSKSIVGDQLDLLIFDECAQVSEQVWTRDLEPTLMDRDGRAMFISTPRGMNWFAQYYFRGQDPEMVKDGWMSLRFSSEDNPHVDSRWVERKKITTPEAIYKQEYEGDFTSMAGLVYPDFSSLMYPKGHVFDPKGFDFENENAYSIFRGVDVGLRHPTACVWIAVDRDGNAYIYREYEEVNPIHEVHAEAIAALSAEKVAVTFISPDAKRKNTLTKDTREDRLCALDMYRKAGVYARPASDNISAGIAEVARYLRATLEDNPLHPRLFISKECPMTIEAFQLYQYKEVNTIKEVDQPEKPRKYKDHLMDAVRYALATTPSYRSVYHSGFAEEYAESESRKHLPSVPIYG